MFSVSILVHLRMLLHLEGSVALKMEVKITFLFTSLHNLLDFKQFLRVEYPKPLPNLEFPLLGV